MTDPRGVCADSAETLKPGVSYVRGWSEGKRGALALAEQLRFAGLSAEFSGLRADVNVIGQGVVCVGAIRPAAAVRLAGLLAAGLAAEIMDEFAREARTDAEEADPADE